MTFGSLFSGIGGMDLGLCRAGMTPVWHSEIDPYACRVLAKHWPGVPNLGDICKIDWSGVERPDLVCGGFPCQDISFAGKGAGLAGKRSGLWYEFARCVRDLRPRFVLVENVSALLVRGLDAVLGTLASLGYDAEWECLPAAHVGAPHIRDRVFILGYAERPRADAFAEAGRPRNAVGEPGGESGRLAHGTGFVLDEQTAPQTSQHQGCFPIGGSGGDAREALAAFRRECRARGGQWESDPADNPESGVGRVAHGIPHRVDRLRGLGNAVVPQVAQFLGERLIAYDNALREMQRAEA